jgi:hypothetical protein
LGAGADKWPSGRDVVDGGKRTTQDDAESSAAQVSDLGGLVAVSAVLLPVFGAINRICWLVPHDGIPSQAAFQVSVGELATWGLIGLFGPAMLAVTVAALHNTVASAWLPLHQAASANTEAEDLLARTTASLDAGQSDIDRLAGEVSDAWASDTPSETPKEAQAERLQAQLRKVQGRIEKDRG